MTALRAEAFRWAAMAALLRQGRGMSAISWLLAAAAIAWLLAASLACDGVPRVACAAALASLAAAAGQAWFALRVDFDARLFAALGADRHRDSDAAPRADRIDDGVLLDATLADLGLVAPAVAPRDWRARWQGARRLLHRQFACGALQALLLVVCVFSGGAVSCSNA